MLQKLNFKLILPVMIFVVAGIAVAREAFKIPKPLLLFVWAMFVVSAIAFWSLQREGKRSVFTQLAIWLLSWSVPTTSALAAVYHFDKAGWMWFKLTGYNVTLAENLQDRVNVPSAAFVARYPFVSCDAADSTRLLIKTGVYDIDETVVVPRGLTLTIAPGTVLRFGVGASLISYSAISAAGTESAPIIFTAQNKWRKWGVVGVVRAGQSRFAHVRFEHGRQALINEIDFLGALSLIDTEAEVTHCQFAALFGKDGAQVHGGQAFFRNNTFHDCFKDGVDFDGGAGEISHNRFVHCGDEAIDLGEGSRVQVFDNVIVDAKDAPKGVGAKLSDTTVPINN
jgi:hypothetical protein